MIGLRTLLRTLLVPLLLGSVAHATTWRIAPGEEGTEVVFHSKAPMESFAGRTRSVTGSISFDPTRLETLEIRVTVDMATLDTGIGLRNGHMRDNHLHTDEFPSGTFTGGAIVEGGGPALAPGEPVSLEIEGELQLHGVTRKIRIPLELKLVAGGDLTVQSSFPVTLSDYDIPRPGFLVMKLGETQRVEVRLLAKAEEPASKPR